MLYSLRLSKDGKACFLRSMTCRNILCAPARNRFVYDEKAARGETGLRHLFSREKAVRNGESRPVTVSAHSWISSGWTRESFVRTPQFQFYPSRHTRFMVS